MKSENSLVGGAEGRKNIEDHVRREGKAGLHGTSI